VYASANKDEPSVEVGGNLAVANLDAVFQKQYRLKTMREWSPETFKNVMGQSIQWCLIIGKPLSGKGELAKIFAPMVGGKIIAMATIAEDVRK
jgi:hypothetical protein